MPEAACSTAQPNLLSRGYIGRMELDGEGTSWAVGAMRTAAAAAAAIGGDVLHNQPTMKIDNGTNEPFELDELDTGIIEILRSNGRATNQEVAEKLSVSAATISSRLRRLEESNAIRVVAVADFAAHGYHMLIAVGVKVFGRDAAAVARDLAKLPEVFSVHLMHGPFDLELLVGLREFEEINVFLTDHVARIPGVFDLSAGIAADIVKFEFNVAPL